MSKFEIYKTKVMSDQCWRWRLVEKNGANIARSEEAFVKGSIKKSINSIQSHVTINTPVVLDDDNEVVKGYKFECFQSKKNDKWYWRLKAGNHEIMAVGGESFSTKQSVMKSIENVKEEMSRASVEFVDS